MAWTGGIDAFSEVERAVVVSAPGLVTLCRFLGESWLVDVANGVSEAPALVVAVPVS